ncbi:MAG: tetratricopeptide repeat protein [Elusimicrobia bacterium]|nr:tetratricopeptide repeat protein [Candidatus Obscuribacterium magneticum]
MADQNSATDISISQHLVYICSRFLAYGLPLVFFLVACSFYLKTYDSAQVKITITQIGGVVLLTVWLIKALVEGRWPFKKADLVFVAPFLGWFASGVMSWLNSPFKGWALEETLRRVFYVAFALIAISEMRSEERMRRLWRWLIAAAWVSIGYGLIQYLDSRFFPSNLPGQLDPFIWRQAFGVRIFSTFGNPNFYGNFLVIVTPLILSSVFRGKGSLTRPFVILGFTVGLVFFIDKMTGRIFGSFDPSFQVVFSAAIILLLICFFLSAAWNVGASMSLPWFLILFALLFLNLYATDTKGAWMGYTSAVAVTLLLIIEYFLHLEERLVELRKYLIFLTVTLFLYAVVDFFMIYSFVLPLFRKSAHQTGFVILWIPTLLACLLSGLVAYWLVRKPWNLKKVVYGVLVVFVLGMGGTVVKYAQGRLISVSFRLFTWISTWEMIRTEPIFGNGVGTFKVIYPAFRRPEIIVLEGKSNTETDHSEDEYVESWQDEGIVGFGFLLWMILTAITCGLKQLKRYSRIRAPDRGGKRKLIEMTNDPRSYEVLGILGAYAGALIHWTVDVSIRFVSSGIFSGLLPGLLVAYARNHDHMIKNEVRLPYDRWIRLTVVLACLFFMWGLRMELVPQSFIPEGYTPSGKIFLFCLLTALALYILLEILEWKNRPEKAVPFSEQYQPVNRQWMIPRVGLIGGILVLSLYAIGNFADQFQADVHHNLAIFFSKQSIWKKEPRYDAQVASLPPDIRDKYRQFGGALEHYQEVNKKNPHFPMALYFTGNVYNDWGSQVLMESENNRAKGDMAEAERLHQKALDMWNLSEDAYRKTKKLAPNYVQTHHQMGLLFVKRAEAAERWGDFKKAEDYYEEALKNFRFYHMLDPVFVPNYDQIVRILLRKKNFKEAEELYRKALYYADNVNVDILNIPSPTRVPSVGLSLAKVLYMGAQEKSQNPFSPVLPQIEEAMKCFKRVIEVDPKNVEALKGLGFMYTKVGRAQEAQPLLQQAYQLAPNDPELKSAFQQR